MDGAFLAHRGLILPGDDAFEQIPELLAEEALAVMSITRLGKRSPRNWPIKRLTGCRSLQLGPARLAIRTLETFQHSPLKNGPGKIRDRVHLDSAALDACMPKWIKESHSAKERLAALYTTRTQYGSDRKLEFGTIARRKLLDDQYEYSICLMPLCDCVRLKNGTSYQFPFWKLRVDNKSASSKGMVVELPDGSFIELFSMGKPRDQLWMGDFKASASKMVVAEKTRGRLPF